MKKYKSWIFWALITASILLCCKCFQISAGSHEVSNAIGGEVFYDCPSASVSLAKIESGAEGISEPKERIEAEPETRTFEITAYCGCTKCCGKSDKITASGVIATEGTTVAADTNILPFGTKVEIDGNVYTVQDRGGAIKGNRLDIYFESHEKALQYGRQTKEVIILKGE